MPAGASAAAELIPSPPTCSNAIRRRVDGGLESRLALDAALAHLSRLPRDQAEVILLRVVVGLDADSVGEILGKRPGTVRVLQHRGLERLAAVLADERVTKPEPCTILETDESLSA